MKSVNVYHIYYDELSKEDLDPGFIPLNNTNSERPDWYEFWAILKYLRTHELQDDSWYGFLSTKFSEKTGFNSNVINHILLTDATNTYHTHDVLLFTSSWDQNCYFKNPFEQGEYHHPNFIQASQKFVDKIGLDLNLNDLVTYSDTSVFSNFVIAKKNYWVKWKELAEKLFEICENEEIEELLAPTKYGPRKKIQTKVFLQERLASLVLLTNNFNVISFDQTLNGGMLVNLHLESMFYDVLKDNFKTFRLLMSCDVLKEHYFKSKNEDFLKTYENLRKNIKF